MRFGRHGGLDHCMRLTTGSPPPRSRPFQLPIDPVTAAPGDEAHRIEARNRTSVRTRRFLGMAFLFPAGPDSTPAFRLDTLRRVRTLHPVEANEGGVLASTRDQTCVHRPAKPKYGLCPPAAGNDPVWAAAITAQANSLRRKLLGDNPSVLEELLVRGVVNGWVAVHRFELELTHRPLRDVRVREDLEKSLGRAQKRMTLSVTALARVRRLQTPKVLAKLQVNLSSDQVLPPPSLETATASQAK